MGLCVVVDKTPRTPEVVEVRLRPLGSPMRHRPGQYLLVRGPDSVQRPYSICNAPRADGEMSLLVSRARGGAMSGWLHDVLAAGDVVPVFGPYGAGAPDLSCDAPVLFLAGGSGLAPILALAEAALGGGYAQPVTLLVSARTKRHLIADDLLAQWGAQYPNFRSLTTLTRARAAGSLHGRIPDVLPQVASDLHGHQVFVAGPRDFVADCLTAARACGAAADSLHPIGDQGRQSAATVDCHL